MANPIYATITAAGNTVYALDHFISPFNVGWDVYVPAGTTVSYTVNGTLDPIDFVPAVGYGNSATPSPVWDQVVQAVATASKSGAVTTPMRALQLSVASISGGPIQLKIVQPFTLN